MFVERHDTLCGGTLNGMYKVKQGRKCSQSNWVNILSGGKATFYQADDIVPAYAAVPTIAELVTGATSLYLLVQFMKLLPAGVVRFMMWRLWSTLVTTSPEEQAFWLGLLREILTTQLSKANLVSVTEEIYDFSAHYHFRSGDLAAWPGKILILESDQDKAFSPAVRAETRAVYPQAYVHTFHDVGHTAIMTSTDEFITIIREFLGEN
jgi:pimeloyl-ACP methyl ester carboxylesterase